MVTASSTVNLGQTSQRHLAFWLWQTALVFAYMFDSGALARELYWMLYREREKRRKLPTGLAIWLAVYDDDARLSRAAVATRQHHPLQRAAEDQPVAVSLTVGYFAAKIVYDPVSLGMAAETARFADFLVPLWPASGGAVAWPPKRVVHVGREYDEILLVV